MQIVIDIPEEMYKVVCRIGSGAPKVIDDAIKNGTPLPRIHGRLIDAEILWNVYHVYDYDFYEALDNTPTTIKAKNENKK